MRHSTGGGDSSSRLDSYEYESEFSSSSGSGLVGAAATEGFDFAVAIGCLGAVVVDCLSLGVAAVDGLPFGDTSGAGSGFGSAAGVGFLVSLSFSGGALIFLPVWGRLSWGCSRPSMVSYLQLSAVKSA